LPVIRGLVENKPQGSKSGLLGRKVGILLLEATKLLIGIQLAVTTPSRAKCTTVGVLNLLFELLRYIINIQVGRRGASK
jgi:hypothetical protein